MDNITKKILLEHSLIFHIGRKMSKQAAMYLTIILEKNS